MNLWKLAIVWCLIQTILLSISGQINYLIAHLIAVTTFVAWTYIINKISQDKVSL